ncbi:hypothetical protein BJF85_01570 [Saccharomonospora sp. CUA-673]|uniref:hypothetical protein n=1 Tax=Saccharomonospora sp. CUA-673 TaxID=1904969 RepID=UPI000966DB53|nr:hypothetical protein [Saccharomonospora sp. CUA-673]OLT45131.1 hypothetical protein BJF85_01570 [Saccharomonospora sp. CUA-673]
MDTTLWIIAGIPVAFAATVLIAFAWAMVSQLRTPLEIRKQQVLDELRKNETHSGATYVSRGFRIGVRDDAVRALAEANGYRWTDYYGRRLTFQRNLQSGPGTSFETGHPSTARGAAPDHSAFLAQLSTLTPDSTGTARIDVGNALPSDQDELARAAETHGWTVVRRESEGGRLLFRVARRGTEPVIKNTEYFIKGPGIEELGRQPGAQRAATDAQREFGVNPLSETAYRDAAAQYKKDSQRTNRWAAAFCLPLLTLVGVAATTARQLTEGGTGATVVLVVWAALALLTLVGLVGVIRAHGRRTANFAPYKNAYEKVAHAVVHADTTGAGPPWTTNGERPSGNSRHDTVLRVVRQEADASS